MIGNTNIQIYISDPMHSAAATFLLTVPLHSPLHSLFHSLLFPLSSNQKKKKKKPNSFYARNEKNQTNKRIGRKKKQSCEAFFIHTSDLVCLQRQHKKNCSIAQYESPFLFSSSAFSLPL